MKESILLILFILQIFDESNLKDKVFKFKCQNKTMTSEVPLNVSALTNTSDGLNKEPERMICPGVCEIDVM